MEKEFVSYEIALKLKELGFDEPCFGWWFVDEQMLIIEKSKKTTSETVVQAPTYSQAFRFFRGKYGLYGIYTMGDDWNNFYWQVWRNDTMTKTFVRSSDSVYDTYEEAELTCLRSLIKIAKEQKQ